MSYFLFVFLGNLRQAIVHSIRTNPKSTSVVSTRKIRLYPKSEGKKSKPKNLKQRAGKNISKVKEEEEEKEKQEKTLRRKPEVVKLTKRSKETRKGEKI